MSSEFEPPIGHGAEMQGSAVRLTDDDGPGYKYVKLAESIAARIRSGEFRSNSRLSPELDMVDEYGVSLGTARSAIRLLRERGLVITVRSKGTFVVDQVQRRTAKSQFSGERVDCDGDERSGIVVDGIVRGDPAKVRLSFVEQGGVQYLGLFVGEEVEPVLLVEVARFIEGVQEISAR